MADANRPNILYIHSHDTGRCIQPYGYSVNTPNLQKLAEEGVVFRHAFCAGPTCSPSRAALLTGQWPHQAGMLGLAHRGWTLHDYSQHLIHHLKEAGYLTALSGIQHVAPRREMVGYDRYLSDGHRYDFEQDLAHPAVEFLNEPDRHKQPFFLSVGFFETHRFSDPGSRNTHRWGGHVGDGRYVSPPHPLPDNAETRADWADFRDAAERLDTQMGRVFDALQRNGLAENTLVIAAADHGIDFPRNKCTLYDGGIGVYLIMRSPGAFSGGKVIDAMVSHVDIFPTLCDWLGLDKPAWLVGESMMPLLTGQAERIREQTFAEINYHVKYLPQRCVRTDKWKYIRRFESPDHHRPPEGNGAISRDFYIAQGWADQPWSEEGLYDLVFDPGEMNNLVDDPRAADALQDMRQRLDQWMRDTHDPLLAGPIPPVKREE